MISSLFFSSPVALCFLRCLCMHTRHSMISFSSNQQPWYIFTNHSPELQAIRVTPYTLLLFCSVTLLLPQFSSLRLRFDAIKSSFCVSASVIATLLCRIWILVLPPY
jgi:hypothetical protein